MDGTTPAASPRPVPVSPSNINAYVASRSSPRDRMKIDRLLSSPRNPWSPRSLLGNREGPQRFTNWVDGSHLKKPRKTHLTKSVGPSTSPCPEQRPGGSTKRKEQENLATFASLLQQQQHPGGMFRPQPEGTHGHCDAGNSSSGWTSEGDVSNADVKVQANLLLSCGASAMAGGGEPHSSVGGSGSGSLHGAAPGGGANMFPVPLLVAAIGDGKLVAGIPQKSLDILEQIIKKVSREQNVIVTVFNEGNVNIHLRVFASNSQEARAVRDYVEANPNQSPAPFVLLAQQLPMAVMYDPSTLNPKLPSAADRLRKQAKTRAIKVLRELIFDPAGGVTGEVLRGRKGAVIPGHRIDDLISQRCVEVRQTARLAGYRFSAATMPLRAACPLPLPCAR